jgi:hypothetical protein
MSNWSAPSLLFCLVQHLVMQKWETICLAVLWKSGNIWLRKKVWLVSEIAANMLYEQLTSMQSIYFFCAQHNLPFTEQWLPPGHSTIKAWLVECCRDGCPSGMFSHLRKETLELCQSDHRVLGHLPDKGRWLLSLARRPALGIALVVPNFFDLRITEATVFFGTFDAADMFWYPSQDLYLNTIMSWSSTDNSFNLIAWFLFWHALSIAGP